MQKSCERLVPKVLPAIARVRFRRHLPGFGVAMTLLCLCPEGSADSTIVKMDIGLLTMGTRLDGKSLAVSPSFDEPDVLKNADLTLRGNGIMAGGTVHALLMIDRTRFGLGVSVYGVAGVETSHARLADGFSIDPGSLWGETIDLTVGREFRLGPVYPFLDLRLAVDVLALGVNLRSDTYGVLGTTQYNRVAFGLGPSLGVFIPMGDLFFTQLSGYAGLFGDELAGTWLSMGVWADAR